MLPRFYPDLRHPPYETAIAVYHLRYSTNIFPTWELAQPFRMLSHNGEINTIDGNITGMRVRGRVAPRRAAVVEQGAAVGADTRRCAGGACRMGSLINMQSSESAKLDNTLELLVLGRRDIRQALTMLVPEAWECVPDKNPAWRVLPVPRWSDGAVGWPAALALLPTLQ
jgi:glutamate synthase (ferredoxin)